MSKPYTRPHVPRMRTWRDIDQRPPLRMQARLWIARRFPRLRACWLILTKREPLPYYPVRPLRRTFRTH